MFQCSYAACYCEENVYKICEAMVAHHSGGGEAELGKASVVFVSNKKRVVPLWRQKAGRDEEKLVIWDYHVILIYRPDHRRDTSQCLVYTQILTRHHLSASPHLAPISLHNSPYTCVPGNVGQTFCFSYFLLLRHFYVNLVLRSINQLYLDIYIY